MILLLYLREGNDHPILDHDDYDDDVTQNIQDGVGLSGSDYRCRLLSSKTDPKTAKLLNNKTQREQLKKIFRIRSHIIIEFYDLLQ